MGNSLRSDNPIAKLNAYPLIFTFSKPCSEVTSATHTPRKKAFEKALRCFLDLLKTAGAFPAYAGFQKKVWSNPLEILKGRKFGVNGTVDA